MAIGKSRVPPLVLTRSGNAGRARSRSSQPFEKAPRSIVKSVYVRAGRMSSQKSNMENKKDRHCLTVFLADSTFPFLFHLQFARTCARVECEEVSHQSIELIGIIDHWEVSRILQINLMHVAWKRVNLLL